MTPIPERRKLLHQLAEHWAFEHWNGKVTSDAFVRKLYGAMLDECKGALKDMADELPVASGTVGTARALVVAAERLEGLRVGE